MYVSFPGSFLSAPGPLTDLLVLVMMSPSRKESYMIVQGDRKKSAAKRARMAEQAMAADRMRAEQTVRRYISHYFSDAHVPEGVEILSKSYVDLCLDSNICDAVDRAYKSMKACGRMQATCGDGTMGEDVRLVLKLLKSIRARCIPQEFSAGILLMHLEILEGVRF
jgi:hypothetical protein